MTDKDKEGRYNVRVLDRAISILTVLSDGNPRTLTEISKEISINSSTIFRLLATLASHDYVTRDEQSGEYRLGLACLELARAYNAGNDLRRTALPELEKLRNATTETVHMTVLDKMEIIYLEKLPGLHAVGLMSSQVGGRAPSHCTGVGKVLLAYLDPQMVRQHFEGTELSRHSDTTIDNLDELMVHLEQVRQQGYAFDHGEHEAEVRCVAAPIFDIDGQAVAAISVSGPYGRMEPLEANTELIEKIVQAAHTISTKNGFRQHDVVSS
jgi:DNA-binding IclR family transcriptional regulator